MRTLTLGYALNSSLDICRYLQSVKTIFPHTLQNMQMVFFCSCFGCSDTFVYCRPGLFGAECIYAVIGSVFASKAVG